MHDFQRPVTILMGLGFPSSINNVARAHAVLTDWPSSQRGPEHEAAMNACSAALNGEADAETARAAFAAFTRRVGILTSDASPVVAAAAAGKLSGRAAPR